MILYACLRQFVFVWLYVPHAFRAYCAYFQRIRSGISSIGAPCRWTNVHLFLRPSVRLPTRLPVFPSASHYGLDFYQRNTSVCGTCMSTVMDYNDQNTSSWCLVMKEIPVVRGLYMIWPLCDRKHCTSRREAHSLFGWSDKMVLDKMARTKWHGQNGTDKMVTTFIDSNSTELNFYSVISSHK